MRIIVFVDYTVIILFLFNITSNLCTITDKNKIVRFLDDQKSDKKDLFDAIEPSSENDIACDIKDIPTATKNETNECHLDIKIKCLVCVDPLVKILNLDKIGKFKCLFWCRRRKKTKVSGDNSDVKKECFCRCCFSTGS